MTVFLSKKAFRAKCEEAARWTGIDVKFYDDKTHAGGDFSIVIVDGALHVRRGGLRAVFDVSDHRRMNMTDSLSLGRRSGRVLMALGLFSVLR